MKRLMLPLSVGLLLAVTSAAWGQVASGNVYGVVTDASGAVLPGATITITGETIAPLTTSSGGQGDFRFLRLDPGTYALAVSLPGFQTLTRAVKVMTGDNVELTFGLKVAAVEETVTVTAETPVVSTKKTGTSLTLAREELERVPQARDPWAILRTIPGVLVDRVNIAGNESGQQSGFVAKGSYEHMWNLDGVPVTDMATYGGSTSYYDFEAFDEISIATGGNDIKAPSGGPSLNFVTKRGTNTFHGTARYLLTHDDLQWSNLPEELATDPRLKNPDGSYRDKADHIQQIGDYGADLGGPIVKDKLWFYGSYGVQDIRLVRLIGTADKTKIRSYNAKLNWQATANDMLSLFYFGADKIKKGRRVWGGAFQESDSYMLDQGGLTPDAGLHIRGLLKLELNHIFSPDLFVNAKYAYFGAGFELAPRGDLSQPGVLDFTNRTAYGSSVFGRTERPQQNLAVDAALFKTALGGTHELKFGFGYRSQTVSSTSVYGGRMQGLKFDASGGLVDLYRDLLYKYEYTYWSGYLGDSFSKGRLTLNLGLRFDSQHGKNLPSATPANPDFPDLLPALDYDGRGTGADWNDLSPRVGVNFALDEARKTVVRASYARYAAQLLGYYGNWDNPNASGYLEYFWDDVNRDGFPSKDEVLTGAGLYYAYGIDPAHPAALTSANRIDPDLGAEHQDELIAGIEREVAPNLSVGAAFTYRRTTNLVWWPFPRNGVTSADYTPDPPVTRVTPLGTFTAQSYSADPAKVEPGTSILNQPDHAYRFAGFELTATKRFSKKWMARLAFSYNDWIEQFDGSTGYPPTSRAVQDPTRTQYYPLVDGGQMSWGGKQYSYTSVKWQLFANALYQLPWGFEISGALFAHQGTPRPYFITVTRPGESLKPVLVDPTIDIRRYAHIWNLDLRLAKNIRVGKASLIASAEMFNALNADIELNRVRDAGARTFNRLDEVLSPRVVRLGLRVTF